MKVALLETVVSSVIVVQVWEIALTSVRFERGVSEPWKYPRQYVNLPRGREVERGQDDSIRRARLRLDR